MYLLLVVALVGAVVWFWGFAALLVLIFAMVCLAGVVAVCDAVTLRQRAIAEGRQAGSFWVHMRQAWRIANQKRSTSATADACQASQSTAPTRPIRKRKMPAVKGHLPHRYRFSYRDSELNYTQRTVNVSHIAEQGHQTYLEGYCELRQDIRTFQTDRIRGKLTDMETGEVITLKHLLSLVSQRRQMSYTPASTTKPSRSNADEGWQIAVLFTGFSASRHDELERMAEGAGWQVRSTVSSSLDYLVTGPRVGPSKLAQAEELGTLVLEETDFLAMLGQ